MADSDDELGKPVAKNYENVVLLLDKIQQLFRKLTLSIFRMWTRPSSKSADRYKK